MMRKEIPLWALVLQAVAIMLTIGFFALRLESRLSAVEARLSAREQLIDHLHIQLDELKSHINGGSKQ